MDFWTYPLKDLRTLDFLVFRIFLDLVFPDLLDSGFPDIGFCRPSNQSIDITNILASQYVNKSIIALLFFYAEGKWLIIPPH